MRIGAASDQVWTRNKSPFVAAVAMNEDGHPMKMRFSMVMVSKGEIKIN